MRKKQDFDYQRYLASREWAERREAVRERANDKCERCGSRMEAVHHLTYANIGREPLEDLQAVCKPCHQFLSAKTALDPRDEVRAGVELAAILIAGAMLATLEEFEDQRELREAAGKLAGVRRLWTFPPTADAILAGVGA